MIRLSSCLSSDTLAHTSKQTIPPSGREESLPYICRSDLGAVFVRPDSKGRKKKFSLAESAPTLQTIRLHKTQHSWRGRTHGRRVFNPFFPPTQDFMLVQDL